MGRPPERKYTSRAFRRKEVVRAFRYGSSPGSAGTCPMGRRALASPAMRETTVTGAMRWSLKAVLRESWLASLGLAVTMLRGLYVLPAAAFATAVAWIALRAAIEGGNGPEEALAISAMILASPRARAIALGLWLSGWLLWGALRVA